MLVNAINETDMRWCTLEDRLWKPLHLQSETENVKRSRLG